MTNNVRDKRYVIDTNIFVSRLLSPKSLPAQIVRYVLDTAKIIVSDDTLTELSNVLMRDKFDKYVSPAARKLFIDGLKSIAIHVEVKKIITVCRDHKDNIILEAAVNGNATSIITGDQDLLVLKEIEKIKILSPQEFGGILPTVIYK